MKITTSLVRSAKRGNIKAIVTLIHLYLESEGIATKTSIQNDRLPIVLKLAQISQQEVQMAAVRKLTVGTKKRPVEKVKVLGKPVNTETLPWNEAIDLPAQPPIEPVATPIDRLPTPSEPVPELAEITLSEAQPKQTLAERAEQGDAEAIVALLIAEIFK